jgi:hypothetical protein
VPGDKICLRLRISHSVNLGGVWAVFRRLPERGEELHDPYITLPGKHYLLSRAGPLRASKVYFEAEIYRERHPPVTTSWRWCALTPTGSMVGMI